MMAATEIPKHWNLDTITGTQPLYLFQIYGRNAASPHICRIHPPHDDADGPVGGGTAQDDLSLVEELPDIGQMLAHHRLFLLHSNYNLPEREEG